MLEIFRLSTMIYIYSDFLMLQKYIYSVKMVDGNYIYSGRMAEFANEPK